MHLVLLLCHSILFILILINDLFTVTHFIYEYNLNIFFATTNYIYCVIYVHVHLVAERDASCHVIVYIVYFNINDLFIVTHFIYEYNLNTFFVMANYIYCVQYVQVYLCTGAVCILSYCFATVVIYSNINNMCTITLFSAYNLIIFLAAAIYIYCLIYVHV